MMCIFIRMLVLMCIFVTVKGADDPDMITYKWNSIEHCLEKLDWLLTSERRGIGLIGRVASSSSRKFLNTLATTFSKIGSISTMIRDAIDPGNPGRAADDLYSVDDVNSILCSLEISKMQNTLYWCQPKAKVREIYFHVAAIITDNYLLVKLFSNITNADLLKTNYTPRKIFTKILPATPKASTLCYISHTSERSWTNPGSEETQFGPYITVLREKSKYMDAEYVIKGYFTLQVDIYMADPGYFAPFVPKPLNKIYKDYKAPT